MHKLRESGLRWLWLCVAIILVDQVGKLLAVHFLSGMRTMTLGPFLKLVLLENRGAAFSFLVSQSGWQVVFFASLAIFVCVMLLIWLSRLPAQSKWICIAINLVIAGALGNFIDRMRLGYVIDFIGVHYNQHYWPVFNFADTAICIGAFMLVVDVLYFSKK